MAIQYQEIANRLRAFRIGSGLSADEIARRVGISRTALYRFEKGELAKIETLEKLSELLNVPMPTLLGVGIVRARVEGYTDSTGTEQYNDQLSQARAQAVADVMIRCGFAAAALTVQGIGERSPVESNETAAGREQNRRVVILVSAIG